MDLNWFLHFIEVSDISSLLLLLVCLALVGSRVIQSRPDLVGWARRIAMTTLLAYTAFRCVTLSPTTPDDLLWILLRGLLSAALAMTVSWTLLPVGMTIWAETFGRLSHAVSVSASNAESRRREREHAAQRQKADLVVSPLIAPLTEEQLREQRDAEARNRIDREAAETASRRREESRLRSELLYERHSRQLTASFPRERFQQFVEKYMGPETAPELVEQREQLLKEMIVDSLGTNTTPKFSTMTELAAFFESRRREIDNLPHDDQIKDTYQTQLNRQEDEALKRFLKP